MWIKTIDIFFNLFSTLIILRLFLIWLPQLNHTRSAQYLYFVTEPYLAWFRRHLPPIGGVFDISPLVAIFCLQIAQQCVQLLSY